MKASIILSALFIGSVAAFATEVEDLAPAIEDLGEETGGYFSALETSGSFTMMQAGGFEKKETELGEDDEALSKRREALAAKLKDFDPRQASGSTVERFLKLLSAEEEDLGQAAVNTTNTAACSGTNQGGQTTGSLDCSANVGGIAGSECPDNLSMGKFWRPDVASGKSYCTELISKGALKGKVYIAPKNIVARLQGVITKAKVHHPHLTSRRTGVIALKRLKCTGNTCDVFKTVVCAKCDQDIFAQTKSNAVTDVELQAWATCIKEKAWDNAGTSTAQLKPGYRCDAPDQAIADMWTKAF